ncbi:hypothetical protein GCM10010406_15810 [Streptomyces thermolineatus]|uniref:Uncharacterized protein n=1 Tax=Streptomyces thermolineatus TaxID=44033 RepID=A0ABN3L9T1_9ACTN
MGALPHRAVGRCRRAPVAARAGARAHGRHRGAVRRFPAGAGPAAPPAGAGARGGCLPAASAAHAVLARTLYAAGPSGTAFPAADLRAGEQLMYYGGDAVEPAAAAVPS